MNQCQHVKNGHCGKCAFVMGKSIPVIKEHRWTMNDKHSKENYMAISADEANSIIKSGIRLNSPTHVRILPN